MARCSSVGLLRHPRTWSALQALWWWTLLRSESPNVYRHGEMPTNRKTDQDRSRGRLGGIQPPSQHINEASLSALPILARL